MFRGTAHVHVNGSTHASVHFTSFFPLFFFTKYPNPIRSTVVLYRSRFPLLSFYSASRFLLLCCSSMPLRPCDPSKSCAFMHRLPYFSTEPTVAGWVCKTVLETSVCVGTSVCGSVSPAAEPQTPESCFGWKCLCCCFFFPDILKETSSSAVS